jgi:hypothetical protein
MPCQCGEHDSFFEFDVPVTRDAEQVDGQRWPTPEAAQASRRADFHRADAAREARGLAREAWEREYIKHFITGTGRPESVDVAPLDPRVMPASTAAWVRAHPRP